jgi:threonine-phosphate decarboxylase
MRVENHKKTIGKRETRDPKQETRKQNPFSHGGNVHAFVRASGARLTEVIDFSASINPLGMPPSARIAYRQALANVVHYPEPYAESLTHALAHYHDLDPSEILVGNGSTQLIYLCARVLASRRVLLVAPLFSEHEAAFRANDAAIDSVMLRPPSFTLGLDRLAHTLAEGRYDTLVLANPNSPTGVLVERVWVKELTRMCRKTRTYLLVDETFIDWREEESLKRSVVQNPRVILFRSLTKFFALPGLRVGYLIAHPTVIGRMKARLEPWSVNIVAQEVGKACLQDQNFIGRSRVFLPRERAWFFSRLQTIPGLRVFPSRANFLLMQLLRQDMTARDLAQRLAQENLLIRPCDNFVGLGNQFLRVAVRTRKENLCLLNTLAEVLT